MCLSPGQEKLLRQLCKNYVEKLVFSEEGAIQKETIA